MKKVALVVVMWLTTCVAYSQRIGEFYYGISSDSLHTRHLLEFKTDSVVELSTFPKHMSKTFRMAFAYSMRNGILHIYANKLKDVDSIALITNGFSQFTQQVNLTPKGKPLLDEQNSIIYVLYKDFHKQYKLTYLIEGKYYHVETSLPDSYGLISREGRQNKRLAKKIAIIEQEVENYTVKVYKGMEAYQKFGYDYVLGVIEINKRK